jgi:hypothetical protein
MNFMRKLLGFFTTVAFVALAAPATAQNVKYFTLGAPTSVPVATTTINVTFKNIENGNSTFNSIGIKGIASGGATLTINSATASPGGPGSPLVTGDGYFYLTGLSPVKKGQTLTVTLTVTLSATGCTNGQIEWQGRAFTGSPSQPSTAFAQQNANPMTVVSAGCSYTITGTTPASMPRGTTKPLTARVTNAASSSATISSVTLTPPVGGAITTPANTYPTSISAGAYADLAISATASCDTAKTAGSWTSDVSGFSHSGEPSTGLTGACGLAVTSAPTSIVPGEPFTIALKATDGEGGTIGGFTGSVTLVSTGAGCTIVGTPSVNADAGLASITVSLSVSATTTTCTLKGTATIDGKTFDTAPLSLTVFDGILGCSSTVFNALDLPATGAGSFDASEGGADAPGETGFLAGVRGYDPDKGVCSDSAKANYAVFNNLPTAYSGTMTDPLGNVVAGGFYSLTWDASQVDPVSGLLLRPVVAVIATLRPEWGAALTGLPTKQTLICTVTPCTAAPYTVSGAINTAGGWKPAVACLSTLVLHSSIPAGEPGCLASERWDVVPAAECPGSPPDGAVPPEGRCLKPTSIMLMGQDPVFGRGN